MKSAQAAFSKFGKFELQGRKHIQNAIVHCYELYLEYEEDFIAKQCKEQKIKFKAKKTAKMVLMLAMQVSDKCDERTNARIRTYVRVLKKFEELEYELDEAEENLEKYGIDYFANPREKKEKSGNDGDDDFDINDKDNDFDASDEDEDNDSDDSENGELDDLRDSDDDDDEDNTNSDDDEDLEDDDDFEDSDDEEDDDFDDDLDDDNDDTESSATTSLSKSSKGAKSVSSKNSDKLLSEKFVSYFKQNGITDKNFVIWVKDDKVQKSKDSALLLELENYDFTDL